LIERVGQLCATAQHTFWPDTVSLRDQTIFKVSFVRGHRQLTDVYLLGLAMAMGGCLATFDRTIPIGAVVGASRETLHVISAAPSGESSPPAR
jgi:hypothetical protein